MKSTETLTLTKEEVEEAIRDYVHDRRGWRPGEVQFNYDYKDRHHFAELTGAKMSRSLDSEE